ncbi:MAG: glycoside hydrolase family 38 C-terminal domain-containing protein, partial [Armatimonadota bacterium]
RRVVKTAVECEFQLADQNWNEEFTTTPVYKDGILIPSQNEKEASNINLDWRKKVVFYAELEPSQMNRFDCRIEIVPKKPEIALKEKDGYISFKTNDMFVEINTKTGLIDNYIVNGYNYCLKDTFKPVVIHDNEDPWGMTVTSYTNTIDEFKLMSPEKSAKHCGVKANSLPSVRVVEDGAARSIVEALFEYNNSTLYMKYILPKFGTEIEIQQTVFWQEKDKMLKLQIPLRKSFNKYIGQVAYGFEELKNNGDECVSQKWAAVVSEDNNKAITIINDCMYGSDFSENGLRISLLRSPAYSAHPIHDRDLIPQNRYTPRIDQGERKFRFWFNAGDINERLTAIDREALAHNEKPFALSFFPSGLGKKAQQFIKLSDDAVNITTIKKAENDNNLIVRLFEPTGNARKTTISLPFCNIEKETELSAFEIKTLKVDITSKTITEVNLLEEDI